MNEDDIQLILKQYKSNFVTYDSSLGIFSINNFSEFVYTMGDHEGTLKNENDISIKTKLILKKFGATFGTASFDEKSFFSTLLGFYTILGLETNQCYSFW